MEKIERYEELSLRLLKIGETLIKEGEEKEDFTILSVGNFILFISSLIYDERDIHMFSELCSMFAAKKMVEGNEVIELLNDLSFTEIEELVKRLKNK